MLTTTTSKSLPASNESVFSAAGHAVEHLRAQHRALVVREGEHHRARAEELAELHVLAVFVAEHQVERQLLPDLLIDPDLAERARLGVDRLGPLRRVRRTARARWPAREAPAPGSAGLQAQASEPPPGLASGRVAARLVWPPPAWSERRRRAARPPEPRATTGPRRPRDRPSAVRFAAGGHVACLRARRRAPDARAAPASGAAPSPCRSARARRRRARRPSRSRGAAPPAPARNALRSVHGVSCSPARASGRPSPAPARRPAASPTGSFFSS